MRLHELAEEIGVSTVDLVLYLERTLRVPVAAPTGHLPDDLVVELRRIGRSEIAPKPYPRPRPPQPARARRTPSSRPAHNDADSQAIRQWLGVDESRQLRRPSSVDEQFRDLDG